MSKVYVALNGDAVGKKISESILSNDPEQVRQVSASFTQAHSQIDQWVEKNGGRVISASGDEAIYEIEHTRLAELEDLMQNYKESTGHTMTAGVGSDMLSAVKGMIYGKMNNPGGLVEYSSEMEDEMSSAQEAEAEEITEDAGEEMPEQDMEEGEEAPEEFAEEMPEEGEEEMQQPQDDEQLPEEMEEESEDLEEVPQDEWSEESPEEFAEDEQDEMQAEQDVQDAEQEDQEEVEQEEADEEEQEEAEDTVKMPKDEFIDEHENLIDTLESPEHEDDLQEADEQRQELEEVQGDEEDSEEDSQDLEEMPEEEFAEEGEEQEEGEEAPEQFAEEGEEMPEEEFAQDEEGEQAPEEMAEEGEEIPELGEEEVAAQGEQDENSPIMDMVHANIDPEEQGEEDDQQVKARVMETLMAFKQNRDKIMSMQQTEPELYQNVMEMINRMIEMAKQLKMNPEQELASQDAMEQVPEAQGEPQIKKPMGGM